ncbi:MAG: NrsF family protein [Polyangiaceae bacterium]
MTSARDSFPDLPWAEPPVPRPEVSQAIHTACSKDLERGRGLGAWQRALLSVLASGAVVSVMFALGLAQSPEDGTLRAGLVAAAGWGIVHAAVLVVGLVRPPGRRGSRELRIAIAVGLPLLFFLYLTLSAHHTLPFARFLREDTHAPTCGLFTLLFGAAAAGGTLLVWRRTDPLTPGLSGALAGLCGGLAGATGIGMACPTHEAWHLWLAHGSTVLVFVAAGWLVGRKWLAP